MDEHEGNPLQLSMLLFVEVDGPKIYKSALLNELNGNLMLSRIGSPKSSTVCCISKPKVQLCRLRDDNYLLKLGHDGAVSFAFQKVVEGVEKRREQVGQTLPPPRLGVWK